MSSRQEADASAVRRGRRFGYVLGGVLVALALGVGVAFGVSALGEAGSSGPAAAGGAAALPPTRNAELTEAAKTAGCKLTSPPNEGAGHEEKQFTASDYAANPPTSGTHFPEWYQDGIYAAGDTPEVGKLVHSLEHGRINLQYRPGTPAQTVRRLEALVEEQDGGYHMLLFENGTKMPHAVAATGWDQAIGCPAMNEQVFDALRAFRAEHIDKGPETVP